MNTSTARLDRWTTLAILAAVALSFNACHQGAPGTSFGTNPGGGGGGMGTIVLFAEDQPSGNILSYEMTISSVTITPSAGSAVPLVTTAVPLEWRSRTVGPTLLGINAVAPATYTSLTVTISSIQMTVFDPISSTFSEVTCPSATCSLSSSSLSVPVSITLAADTFQGLRLDFDLRSSITLNPMNNFVVTPMFTAVPTSFVSGQVQGELDDVLGTIGTPSTLNGNFPFTVFSSNQMVTVPVDSNTRFEQVSGLTGLSNGERVELDARLQSNGNFLALEVERETTSTSAQQLRGLVLSRTPAVGTLTSLNLLVMDAIPTPPAAQEPGEIVTVTVDSSSTFRISTEDLPTASFPNLDFDRTTLQAGQFIHVVQRTGATGFTADAVTLDEIALTGQVGSSVGANSFTFVPDGDFFNSIGLGTINVQVTSPTELENMPAGLASLQPNISIVAVRGVLVFSAGNGVLMAKRVRLLQ
ncbi:MAG TPA: DUF5666 domain-containing protein [Candidatus Xenobia bacterium]|nr:DUF5666 domain-containing protein [Candidatus Xenobia bacterium]